MADQGLSSAATEERKRAIAIMSSGLVIPLLRKFCDDATPLIKSTIGDSLNAKLGGTLYAGGVEKVGLERYLDRSRRLGRRLAP